MLVGPENVKKILFGEHTLVISIWPPSLRAAPGEGTLSMMDVHHHKLYKKVRINTGLISINTYVLKNDF